jgi:DNA repair ATPase RecN
MSENNPDERRLSLSDLVEGEVTSEDVVSEVMEQHDYLTLDSELTERDFIDYFCDSSQAGSGILEDHMRRKFQRLAATLQQNKKNTQRTSTLLTRQKSMRSSSKELERKSPRGVSRESSKESQGHRRRSSSKGSPKRQISAEAQRQLSGASGRSASKQSRSSSKDSVDDDDDEKNAGFSLAELIAGADLNATFNWFDACEDGFEAPQEPDDCSTAGNFSMSRRQSSV